MDWTLNRDGVAVRAPRQIFHNKILFCDMAGYSRQEPLRQAACQDALNIAVDGVLGELGCDPKGDVIALPTGDGMLLNFLVPAPDIHLRAAVDLLRRWAPTGGETGETAGLKIGLNTDVDAWGLDINGQRNVVGNGVNIAQRIMDLGRPGQILMHDRVRSDLSQSLDYSSKLSFRGNFRVKHDLSVPVAQFVDQTLPFVSGQLIEPAPVAAAPLSLSDLFGQVRGERVLALVLGPEDAPNVRHVQDAVEDYLLRHGSLLRLRLRAHWLVGELLDNVFNHAGLMAGEQVELRLDIVRDGLVIETSQPKRPGFERASILRSAAAGESFLHMMGTGGQTPRLYEEGGRLVIGLKLSLDEGLLSDVVAVGPTTAHPNSWSLELESGRLVARPCGRVDETTHEAFAQNLLSAVAQARAKALSLVVDLSGLNYMSSRGLRALTLARREGGDVTSIVLAAPNPRMREILAISRYDKLFEVRDEV